MNASDRLKHFFHVVSNIRPIVWICLYILFIPIFAGIYSCMPVGEFRIPEHAPTNYGSWLYYSTVTITTLGFGDYTPALPMAQCFTALEVTIGLLLMGFFLNAVGSMKSEIDVASELEKQRLVHKAEEKEKLEKMTPIILRKLNRFLAYCYAVTTPLSSRNDSNPDYNPEFTFQEMHDMYKPSGLPFDFSQRPAVEGLVKVAQDTSLFLDQLQSRIDLTIWPEFLEDSFSFVAHSQLFQATDAVIDRPRKLAGEKKDLTLDEAKKIVSDEIKNYSGVIETSPGNNLNPALELYTYIKDNARLARDMETVLTKISATK